MVRETIYHGWSVPEAGDEFYHFTFDDLADAIDESLAERLEDPIPSRSRWIVDSGDGWPTLAYDNASIIRQIETAPRWDAIPFTATDREEEIIGRWEWRPGASIDADIEGRSVFADHVEDADDADVTNLLDGKPVDAFASRIADRTVTGRWTHANQVTIGDGMRVTGGTLDLPVHD